MENFPLVGAALFAVAMILAANTLELPPCETEDSSWCYWDAATRGNGEGRSFIALWGE